MDLDIKQMMTMVDVISEEKGLPKETVLDVIQQAIAAAWRKDNGTKDMDVRCELNTNDGTAEVFIQREVVEDDVEVNPDKEINLNGITFRMMDRNLGALSPNDKGFWYQWGNNYGFEEGENGFTPAISTEMISATPSE